MRYDYAGAEQRRIEKIESNSRRRYCGSVYRLAHSSADQWLLYADGVCIGGPYSLTQAMAALDAVAPKELP